MIFYKIHLVKVVSVLVGHALEQGMVLVVVPPHREVETSDIRY